MRMNQAEWERSRAEAEQLQEKVEKSQGEIYRLKAKLENAQSEKENLQVSHFCPPPLRQIRREIQFLAVRLSIESPPQICFSPFRRKNTNGVRAACRACTPSGTRPSPTWRKCAKSWNGVKARWANCSCSRKRLSKDTTRPRTRWIDSKSVWIKPWPSLAK